MSIKTIDYFLIENCMPFPSISEKILNDTESVEKIMNEVDKVDVLRKNNN